MRMRGDSQLRKIQRQSVAINQGVPVSGISNIHREQADLLAAMNIRKPEGVLNFV